MFTTATCVPQPLPFESRTVAPASMMFSTTQEVEEEQLDSLPLTVNEKFPAGNGIDPSAIACEPAAKLIASAPKNIRRVFIGSPLLREKHHGNIIAVECGRKYRRQSGKVSKPVNSSVCFAQNRRTAAARWVPEDAV